MGEPLKRSPYREEEERPPQQSPAATPALLSSAHKNILGEKEGSVSKVLHIRSLLRETEHAIPPPRPGEWREAPATSSYLPRQEKTSFDIQHGSPRKERTFTSLRREESSLPLSYPLPPPPPCESAAKSPVGEGEMVVTRLRSFLEDCGSPSPQPESLPVANRMAATSAPAAAKLGASVGKGMVMEQGVVRSAALLRTEVLIRVLEVVLCLVSFSVMAAGKTRGWDGDSFDRYNEYRYCLSMNVLAFTYSMFQLYEHIHHRITRRHIISRPLSYYFDFFMDQLLAYLLLSASSSAATRNEEWVAMFGGDKFTDKMGSSVAVSFLAFLAFAISCIISAYKLFNWSV